VFRPSFGAQWIVGAIGVLQLDVLAARARQEYRIEIEFEPAPYVAARWLRAADDRDLKAFIKAHENSVLRDRDGQPVFLAASPWELDYRIENNQRIEFLKTKELE
jgi:peptide chain release factor 3